MRPYTYKIAMLVLAAGMIFTACKKDKDTETEDNTEEISSSSDDARFSDESEQAIEDANTLLSGSSLAGAKTAAVSICGATIDSSQKTNGIITMNFDGTSTCINNTRTRSGSITLSLPAGVKWADAGAVLTITFNNYKVTRVSDGKSVTFSGSKTITNVTGGLSRNLTSGGSIEHKVRGAITITFDDNSQRSWQIARKRTISVDGSTYAVITEGDTTVAGNSNVVIWGQNRYGRAFYGVIEQPIINNSDCEWHAVSGKRILKGLLREVTLTFGVDNAGNPVSSGNCPYGFKINWTNKAGDTKQSIIQYK
jgi:hypothetical protein